MTVVAFAVPEPAPTPDHNLCECDNPHPVPVWFGTARECATCRRRWEE
jgi:hypothetical protein